jgi:hypothetical protein
MICKLTQEKKEKNNERILLHTLCVFHSKEVCNHENLLWDQTKNEIVAPYHLAH